MFTGGMTTGCIFWKTSCWDMVLSISDSWVSGGVFIYIFVRLVTIFLAELLYLGDGDDSYFLENKLLVPICWDIVLLIWRLDCWSIFQLSKVLKFLTNPFYYQESIKFSRLFLVIRTVFKYLKYSGFLQIYLIIKNPQNFYNHL